jgi:hypothetical protein
MPVMALARFERFFRSGAGLDVDKEDLKALRRFREPARRPPPPAASYS